MTLTKNEPQAPGATGPTVLMRLPESAEKVVALYKDNFSPGTRPRFTHIKMPTGGKTTWTVPGSTGTEEVSELIGVVLLQRSPRSYWVSQEITGESPDCLSEDGITGSANPRASSLGAGGSCASCPMNKWHSDPKGGRGKACAQKLRYFLLRSGRNLPIVLTMSPGSLASMELYESQLTDEGLNLLEVVTGIGLAEARNDRKQVYSRTVPRNLGSLNQEDVAKVQAMGAALGILLEGQAIEEDGDLDPPGDGSLPGSPPPGASGDISIPLTEVDSPSTRLSISGGASWSPEPPTSWRWGKIVALPELAYSANGSPVVLLQVSDGLGHQEEMIAVGDIAEQLNVFPVGAELKLQGEYRSTSRKGAMVNTYWVTSFERVLPREQLAHDAQPDKDDFPF